MIMPVVVSAVIVPMPVVVRAVVLPMPMPMAVIRAGGAVVRVFMPAHGWKALTHWRSRATSSGLRSRP